MPVTFVSPETMPVGNGLTARLNGVGQVRTSAKGNLCCVVVFGDIMGRTALYNVNLVNPVIGDDGNLAIPQGVSVSFDILARALGKKLDPQVIIDAEAEGCKTGDPIGSINEAIRNWIADFKGTEVVVNTESSPNGNSTTVKNFGRNAPILAKIRSLGMTAKDAADVDAILG